MTTTPRKRVAFILRSDALSKRGGDTVQAESYVRHLVGLGFDVDLCPFRLSFDYSSYDIVHHFNIDRPFELLAVNRRATTPLFISSIHHSDARLRLLRKAERRMGLRGVLASMPLPMRELVTFAARALHDRTATRGQRLLAIMRAIGDATRLRADVAKALQSAGCVFVLAVTEKHDIERDYRVRLENSVLVPNGMDHAPPPSSQDGERVTGIIAVGRIEARKRQLEVLEAAEREAVAVTFAGQASPSSSDYAKRFIDAANRSLYCSYVGELTRDETSELMSRSRVLLNASWVEVQSLVDIEGAALGCRVVTSPTGSSLEHLGPSVVSRAVNDDVTAMLRVAAEISVEHASTRSPYDWTWAAAAERIAMSYSCVDE